MISHPPPIQSFGLKHSTVLRFTATAAAGQTEITFQNLIDTLNFAATAVTAFQIFRAVKIRKVEVWAVPVIGNPATVTVEFNGGTVGSAGDQVIHTDTSMGIEPAHVLAKPSPRSAVSLYQENTGLNAFQISCPAGSVIDIGLSFKGIPNIATATQNVPAASTAGAWYYRGFDGLALAATNFPPIVPGSQAN
jgi:hypothetical protein